MQTLLYNTTFGNRYSSNKDVLTSFKEKNEKKINIDQGMSNEKISKIFSKQIINVVRQQFEAFKT